MKYYEDDYTDYDKLVVDYMNAIAEWDRVNVQTFDRLMNLFHIVMDYEQQVYEAHLKHRFK